MKEAIQVDLDGFYIEPVIVPFSQTGVSEILEMSPAEVGEEPVNIVTGYIIAEKVPEGLYTPRWDFTNSEWGEGLTEKEVDEIRAFQQPVATEQRVTRIKRQSTVFRLASPLWNLLSKKVKTKWHKSTPT
ncbi:hypothetical protein [Cohnella boryungensis]|uniref:Uncharacterized protein n=1 Tax=Cohnella boryungensis TaxID=768479 RepID=A0ABV8S7T3_9BACL